jgi:hypothetical protein
MLLKVLLLESGLWLGRYGILKAKQRDKIKYGEYRNCDFILGSGAEIDRVWSAAEKILIPNLLHHSNSSARAILFLRFNENYWKKVLYMTDD